MAMKAGPSSPTVQQPVRHHLPPALMTFPLFRDELGDALAGLDTAEEVLAANPSDAGARDGLSAKVAALSSSLSAAVERRCSEKDIVPRCVEVIDIGQSKFEPVYNSTFDAINSSEEAGAAECSDAVRRLIEESQGKRATQKSDDVVQLYAAAASIREQVRRLMKAVAGETGAELAKIPEKARRRHGLKQIVRIVEKCALRPDEPGKADRVCDIVRDMFSVSSMEQMAKVAVALLSCSEIAIVRVKDRNAEPSAGGWRDVMPTNTCTTLSRGRRCGRVTRVNPPLRVDALSRIHFISIVLELYGTVQYGFKKINKVLLYMYLSRSLNLR